jgi:hypothetical protein
VHAMAIPHETDPYTRLAGSVPLPAKRGATVARRGRRRHLAEADAAQAASETA